VRIVSFLTVVNDVGLEFPLRGNVFKQDSLGFGCDPTLI
jgi:hypothetical protein